MPVDYRRNVLRFLLDTTEQRWLATVTFEAITAMTDALRAPPQPSPEHRTHPANAGDVVRQAGRAGTPRPGALADTRASSPRGDGQASGQPSLYNPLYR
jgi:hypothetical protein